MLPRLLALLLATTLFAADAPKAKTPAAPKPPEPPVYLTEKEALEAGEDPRLQGEFANAKMGADVIALGKGEYRLVLFKGGLPGAGWDGTPRIEVEGKKEGDVVKFQDKIDSATLADGVLTIKSNGFKLKRLIRHSQTEGLPAPKGAVILFDGKSAQVRRPPVQVHRHNRANAMLLQAFLQLAGVYCVSGRVNIDQQGCGTAHLNRRDGCHRCV